MNETNHIDASVTGGPITNGHIINGSVTMPDGPITNGSNTPVWDNSFLGDITNEIKEQNIGIEDYRYRNIPVTIHKFDSTTFLDVASDIVKGIFYLPTIGSHIGIIQKSSIDSDGNEIITRARYVIRPVVETAPLSTFNPTVFSSFELELIRKLFIFAYIMRFKNITEDIIEIRKLNNVHIPLLNELRSSGVSLLNTSGIGTQLLNELRSSGVSLLNERSSSGVSLLNPDLIRKWFGPGNDIFNTAVQEYLKPYRSPIALRYKMEKLLSKYIPEKRTEYELWLNDIVRALTPAPSKEVAKEPVRREYNLLPLPGHSR